MIEINPKITLKLVSTEPAPGDIPELSKSLCRDLLDLNESVESADIATTIPGEDVKSGAGLDWNNIIITLITSGGIATTAITAVVAAVEAFLKRNEGRNLTIEFSNGSKLTATNMTPEEQKRLTDALLSDVRGFTPRSS